MKFKEVLKFEKENMPDFQWKLEKFLFVFLVVWIGGAILTICACLAIELSSGEDGGLWYIPLIVWACAVFGMLIPLIIKSKKVRANLWRYHTEKLNREFYDIDYTEARQNLIDGGKMTEEGFIVTHENGTSEVIPFDDVEIAFNPHYWGGKIFMYLVFQDNKDRAFADEMDNGFYNFLIHIRV